MSDAAAPQGSSAEADAIARRQGDGIRAAAAGVIVAMVLLTVWATLTPPPSIAWADLGDGGSLGIVTTEYGIADVLAPFGVIAVGFVVGMYGWALIVQRRRLWPIGPRRPRLQSRAAVRVVPGGVALLTGQYVPLVFLSDRSHSIGVGDLLLVDLSGTPVSMAMRLVTNIAVTFVVYVVVLLLVEELARDWWAEEPVYWYEPREPSVSTADTVAG